jgi:hypothetical protein
MILEYKNDNSHQYANSNANAKLNRHKKKTDCNVVTNVDTRNFCHVDDLGVEFHVV